MKEVHFTNAISLANEDGKMVFTFDSLVIVDGVESGSQKGMTVIVQDGDTVEETFRKLADDNAEIFLNGESIGFGALNDGTGMTPAQLEHSASTPEADADIVPEA